MAIARRSDYSKQNSMLLINYIINNITVSDFRSLKDFGNLGMPKAGPAAFS